MYVPNACSDGSEQCKLHFALHGCGGNAGSYGENTSYYNEIGALNNIIMVYPDTRCWDNAPDNGVVDSQNYNTKNGVIPRAFKSMMDHLTGGAAEGSDCGDSPAPEPVDPVDPEPVDPVDPEPEPVEPDESEPVDPEDCTG